MDANKYSLQNPRQKANDTTFLVKAKVKDLKLIQLSGQLHSSTIGFWRLLQTKHIYYVYTLF